MKRILCGLLVFAISIIIFNFEASAAPPEQVHLATNGIPGDMVVQWGTQEDTTALCDSDNIVEYGTDSNNLNLSKVGLGIQQKIILKLEFKN